MNLIKIIKQILIWLPAIGAVFESILIFLAYYKILPGEWDVVILGLACLALIFVGFYLSANLLEKKDSTIKKMVG